MENTILAFNFFPSHIYTHTHTTIYIAHSNIYYIVSSVLPQLSFWSLSTSDLLFNVQTTIKVQLEDPRMILTVQKYIDFCWAQNILRQSVALAHAEYSELKDKRRGVAARGSPCPFPASLSLSYICPRISFPKVRCMLKLLSPKDRHKIWPCRILTSISLQYMLLINSKFFPKV